MLTKYVVSWRVRGCESKYLETSILFTIVAAPVYIPTNNVGGFPFPGFEDQIYIHLNHDLHYCLDLSVWSLQAEEFPYVSVCLQQCLCPRPPLFSSVVLLAPCSAPQPVPLAFFWGAVTRTIQSIWVENFRCKVLTSFHSCLRPFALSPRAWEGC